MRIQQRRIAQDRTRQRIAITAAAVVIFSVACNRKSSEPSPDHPRLVPNVALHDVTFHGASLNREMPYRVLMPAADPFVLARSADPAKTPFLFLTCGDEEGLLPTNRSFAKLLQERGFKYEFHVVPGGHSWSQWNERLDDLFLSLRKHLGADH